MGKPRFVLQWNFEPDYIRQAHESNIPQKYMSLYLLSGEAAIVNFIFIVIGRGIEPRSSVHKASTFTITPLKKICLIY